MRKTLVIAVREFQAAVRTKTFAISLVIMPVMGTAGLVAAFTLRNQVNIDDKHFAVIDHTGKLYDKLASAADYYNRTHIFAERPDGSPSDQQSKPRFVLEKVAKRPRVATRGSSDQMDQIRARLSQRVRQGTLTAFVEIGPHALDPRKAATDGAAAIVHYSNNPMYRDFVDWFSWQVNESIRTWRVADAGLPRETVDWATGQLHVAERPLFEVTASGVVLAGKVNDHYVSIAAGVGMALLMFLVILIGAIPLTYSVLEEKMQRSAEVLLGSVTSFQFMMGKILGMVGVSLSTMTIYIVVGYLAASFYGYGHTLPRHLIYWFILYQAGSILMFGSLFAAIGAACNDMKDAQNLMAPASIIACIPLFVLRPVMMEPNSTFSTLVSFFPPATPVLMLLRQGLPAPVPVWQPVLGLVLVLATAFLCVALAARVFQVGILMQGKGANVKEIVQWAFYGMGHRPARPERRQDLAGSTQ